MFFCPSPPLKLKPKASKRGNTCRIRDLPFQPMGQVTIFLEKFSVSYTLQDSSLIKSIKSKDGS